MASVVGKVSGDIRDRYEFARTHVKRDTILLQMALFFIVLIGFIIRFLAVLEFDPILRANDPYSQLTVARFINENGLFEFFSFYDTNSWYPYGRSWGTSHYVGTPLSAVIFHRFTLLIGIPLSLETSAYIIPGIWGSLTIFLIYFVGKEIANKKVGLFAAFFLSVSPAPF